MTILSAGPGLLLGEDLAKMMPPGAGRQLQLQRSIVVKNALG